MLYDIAIKTERVMAMFTMRNILGVILVLIGTVIVNMDARGEEQND